MSSRRTGSVARHPDGRWFMFYTGASLNEVGANVQSIGYAVSSDPYTWDKAPEPVLSTDPRWYETFADGNWHDEAFRDPWVFADQDGAGRHMLITARANHSDAVDRGVVGHAWSCDLETWELREPLSWSGQGFGQLEVLQPFVVDGRDVPLFNCRVGDMPEAARAGGVTGGVWIADAKSPLGPYDIAGAKVIDDPSLYVGKFVTERETGDTKLLAFVHDRDGAFVGEITDPYAVTWDGDRLALTPSQGHGQAASD